MLTPFGKFVRKWRIEKGVNMKEMANSLGISTAFLSAIETGKKTVPTSLTEEIAKYFNLSPSEHGELRSLADRDREKITIPILDQVSEKRELATTFARRFDDLSEADVKKLMRLLNK